MAGVSTVTGFAANVSSSVLSGLWNKVVQAVKMVISTPQAVADMEVQAQRLDNVIHGINEKLGQEQKPPKRIVKVWLDKADEAIKSSRSIGNEYQQHKNCLSCCPNCFCRYKISKRIIDWKVNVDRLHTEKQSDFPPNGEYGDFNPLTQIPIHIPSPGFVGDAIKSAQSKLEEWLTEDNNIRIIGVHGMGGVGKTSLLQNINNSQKVSSSFALIIWVTVSKDYDISNLQDCIADRLKLQLPHKSNMPEREYKLCSCLKDKKCLLILDDMWKSLELQSLGVSLDESSCKIVLSTRDKEVCAKMGAKDIITVVPLSEEKAWELFCSRAFGNESVPQEIEDIARGIARECKGLPLAINVVAAAMTNYSSHEWELCLSQIQNIDERFYGLHTEIEEKLFQRLKWSYNGLQDDLKTCFVYFAAYPEDKKINCEEVIDIWIAEGLLKERGEIYLRDIGHSYINFLRDRCLIEVVRNDEVGRVESVKIHDILRDLAILIAEKEHGCYFKAGQGLSHFPSEEDSEGCERMSLMKKGLHSLPTTFRCSSLSVLLLRKNNAIEEVPGSFLNELRSLRVLDLSRTGITSLPDCIENLKHLASLQLKGTKISELPEIICDLKELQFLNVRGCWQLRFLPERISELKSLRALDISDCKTLSDLPRGISELVTLERLTMMGSSIQLRDSSSIRFDFEDIRLDFEKEERRYGCLEDLQNLRRLRVLEVQIKFSLKEGVMGNWSKMRDLRLYFRDANQDYLPHDMQLMKDLERFTLEGCDVERLPSWVSEFRKLANLQLYHCKQLKELPAELPCLRMLWIQDCHKLEELELGMGFPKLERLGLWSLKSLECVGAVAAASGSGGLGEGASPLPPMLKSVIVDECPKLKRLRGGWDKLKCLEVIKVYPREWWDAIQWEDPNMKASLESKVRRLYY